MDNLRLLIVHLTVIICFRVTWIIVGVLLVILAVLLVALLIVILVRRQRHKQWKKSHDIPWVQYHCCIGIYITAVFPVFTIMSHFIAQYCIAAHVMVNTLGYRQVQNFLTAGILFWLYSVCFCISNKWHDIAWSEEFVMEWIVQALCIYWRRAVVQCTFTEMGDSNILLASH